MRAGIYRDEANCARLGDAVRGRFLALFARLRRIGVAERLAVVTLYTDAGRSAFADALSSFSQPHWGVIDADQMLPPEHRPAFPRTGGLRMVPMRTCYPENTVTALSETIGSRIGCAGSERRKCRYAE